LWALQRTDDPAEELDEEDPEAGSGLDPSTAPPLARGIIAHGCLAQLYQRQLTKQEGGDPTVWATARYALLHGMSQAAGRGDEDAHKAGAWADTASPEAIQAVFDKHWPQGKLMPDQINRWIRERWALPPMRPEVRSVEEPVAVWFDPGAQPKSRYGVVPAPLDAPSRLSAYKMLRTPDWRAGLSILHRCGPPYLFTTRMDASTVERNKLTGSKKVWITDFKTGMRTDKRKHQGYQNSGQIVGLDIYGRENYPVFGGVVIDYLPWLGKPWAAQAQVAESHRLAFASMLADHWQRLTALHDQPLHRWPLALDEQVCRTIYTNPCAFYDRCRGVGTTEEA